MKTLLQRMVPDSLPGQVMLLFVVGIVLLQGINFILLANVQKSYLVQTHDDRVGTAASRYFLLDPLSPEQRASMVAGINAAQQEASWQMGLTLRPSMESWNQNEAAPDPAKTMEILQERFTRKGLSAPKIQIRVLNRDAKASAEPYVATIFDRTEATRFPLLEVAMQLHDGTWVSVMQSIQLNDTRIVWIQRLQLVAVAAVFAFFVALILRKVTRPLRRLEQAAEQFGKRPDEVHPLPETGTREVREAAHSFNRMRHMIRNNFAERDRMLAAMAHDLRTPLTRLQLRLEDVEPESLRDRLTANCLEVQSIIEQGMELARSLHMPEAPVSLDLSALVQSIADDNTAEGHKVLFQEGADASKEACFVTVRPLCLKRCIDNLLSNALRYAGSAEMKLLRDGEHVTLEIVDNGPGIPESELEKVFEPYYRVEASRNRDSGGTGLGLAIARNMALLDGNILTLQNRPEGGLRATLRFSVPK